MRLNLYAKLLEIQPRNRRQIDSFLQNAPNRYWVFTIPKRNGGVRIIAHPSRELKSFQHKMITILEANFQVHKNAVAYKSGCGIKENALMHSINPYVLKMDFSDFFNSITPNLFFMACKRNNYELSKAEKRVLTKTLFWNKAKSQSGRLSLSVGAPSSPLVSNIVMLTFDEEITNFCNKSGIVYSRYADDLTFSSHNKSDLFNLPDIIRVFLNNEYHNRITINERKTVFTSRACNRNVTGITITPQGMLSVGRERKRLISSLIHKYSLNLLNLEMSYHLQGLLSFASYIEPDFKIRMSKKYSAGIVAEILKLRKENESK